MDGFLRKRTDTLEKVEGKRVALRILEDQNQALKRKYIKKQLDYKRVCRGKEIEEPNNFLEQMIKDIKKDLSEKLTSTTVPPLEEPTQAQQPSAPPLVEEPMHQRALSDHQPSPQCSSPEPLLTPQHPPRQPHTYCEVKTISERSPREEDESNASSQPPPVTYNSTDGVFDLASRPSSKPPGQIQILDLLNEICEVNEDDH